MVVHNRGYGAKLEDALFHKRIIGHYRLDGGNLLALQSKVSGQDKVSGETESKRGDGKSTETKSRARQLARISLPGG